ncbi:alpha subunit of ribonucleoside diphosphate reductase [Sesbania bispinosa]|nr:alpha subunit of ribonucleoside diphosphate reductase [Sesbania bispinosa]
MTTNVSEDSQDPCVLSSTSYKAYSSGFSHCMNFKTDHHTAKLKKRCTNKIKTQKS